MSNSRTKGTTLRSVMRTKAFNDGFRACRNGEHFDYDYAKDTNAQWAYERGRLFALVFRGDVKSGNRIYSRAIFAMNDAVWEGTVI